MFTNPHFRQAQIHAGLSPSATPATVALTVLARAAQDLAACVAVDPSLLLTLPVKTGLVQDLIAFAKEADDARA